MLLPKDNEKDLADIPPEIQSASIIHFVETMDEVLALGAGTARATPVLPAVPEVAAKFGVEAEQDQELTN